MSNGGLSGETQLCFTCESSIVKALSMFSSLSSESLVVDDTFHCSSDFINHSKPCHQSWSTKNLLELHPRLPTSAGFLFVSI